MDWILATAGLCATLVTLSIWDIIARRLPDVITVLLIVAGLLYTASVSAGEVLLNVMGTVVGYIVLLAVECGYRLVRKERGLGRGDAKLLSAAGAWLGPFALPPLILIAATSALLAVGIIALTGRSVGLHTAIAFGPFLCLGFFLLWVAKLAGWPCY